jgi:ribosome-associated protein
MDPDDAQDRPSKSAAKRAHHAIQDLGEALIALPDDQLATLPLDEEARDAVVAGRGLVRGALRRQVRYLGRVLARRDTEALRAALEAQQSTGVEATARLHRLERWRERLLAEGDAALEELLRDHPDLDRSRLRQLVRRARAGRHGAARALFRFLRDSDAAS